MDPGTWAACGGSTRQADRPRSDARSPAGTVSLAQGELFRARFQFEGNRQVEEWSETCRAGPGSSLQVRSLGSSLKSPRWVASCGLEWTEELERMNCSS